MFTKHIKHSFDCKMYNIFDRGRYLFSLKYNIILLFHQKLSLFTYKLFKHVPPCPPSPPLLPQWTLVGYSRSSYNIVRLLAIVDFWSNSNISFNHSPWDIIWWMVLLAYHDLYSVVHTINTLLLYQLHVVFFLSSPFWRFKVVKRATDIAI